MLRHLACEVGQLHITALGTWSYWSPQTWEEFGLHAHLIPWLSLCKMLDVKVSVCRIFLVRYEGSAGFFILHGKSHGCALGVLLLAGVGDVSPNPLGVQLLLHSICVDPKYFCFILVELVTTYIFASYIFVTQTILSFTAGRFWPRQALFKG